MHLLKLIEDFNCMRVVYFWGKVHTFGYVSVLWMMMTWLYFNCQAFTKQRSVFIFIGPHCISSPSQRGLSSYYPSFFHRLSFCAMYVSQHHKICTYTHPSLWTSLVSIPTLYTPQAIWFLSPSYPLNMHTKGIPEMLGPTGSNPRRIARRCCCCCFFFFK